MSKPRLNVGCGDVRVRGWVNVDLTFLDTIDLQASATALPFADRTFERVYGGHVFEHVPPAAAGAFLGELVRVGGTVALVWPDLLEARRGRREGWMPAQTLEEMTHGGHRWPGDEHRQFPTPQQLPAGWTVTTTGELERSGWPVTNAEAPCQHAVIRRRLSFR